MSLKQELAKIEIPAELHERSKLGVKRAKAERGGRVKKYVLTCALALALIVPTGALAYQAFLADEYYGSFENLKKHIGSATMEGYLLLDAKLTQAKGDLTEAEYAEFQTLLKEITAAKLNYGNSEGYTDYSQIPPEELAQLKEVLFAIQPYFDKLNGQVSSKEILTQTEYDQYIEALMTYEGILSQSGDRENIPADLQLEFSQSEAFLDYVNHKQLERQGDVPPQS